MKSPASVLVLDVEGVQDETGRPLYARIEQRIRRAILSGNLATGARLPSARVLAHDLGVSRHTIEWALGQLEVEGFLVRRRGAGTYVAENLPERARPPAGAPAPRRRVPSPATLSPRGEILAELPPRPSPPGAPLFSPSMPALELFPRSVWAAMVARALREPGIEYFAYGPSGGLPALQEAIAAHVAGTRAIACAPEQVVVLSSTQQGIDLAARVLLHDGDGAWMEDPGYRPAAQLLAAAGARVRSIPVDDEGLDVDAALALDPRARIAYVTPSHQYPTGALMSLRRRMALVDWAERHDGWILEDDYDGDLRYVGRPLAALHALDAAQRVIYIGTFNKMMFPSLRLAFLIAPPSLVTAFHATKQVLDGHTPIHAQAALAEFIRDGHLAAHLRRILPEYQARRQALLDALAPLGDRFEIGPSEAGLHVMIRARDAFDDVAVGRTGPAHGLDLVPLSPFHRAGRSAGFILGFGCARPARLRAGVATLQRLLADADRPPPRSRKVAR